MRKSLVTLFVLVALLAVSVASVSAGGNKITICHGTGNPHHPYNQIRVDDDATYQGHANHVNDGQHNDLIPMPADGCPQGDGGDDDDDGDNGGGNDDGNTGGGDVDAGDIVAEAPAPALIQITVWPDTLQVANLTGFTWTIDGNPIYDDRNNNGVMDTGERIVTAVEQRNRPVCGEPGPNVPNQPMSRLVLNITRDEVPGGDLNAFLSRFQAQINGAPVTWGWYDIDGEFAPCVPAFDGVTQHRQG